MRDKLKELELTPNRHNGNIIVNDVRSFTITNINEIRFYYQNSTAISVSSIQRVTEIILVLFPDFARVVKPRHLNICDDLYEYIYNRPLKDLYYVSELRIGFDQGEEHIKVRFTLMDIEGINGELHYLTAYENDRGEQLLRL